MSFKRSGRLAAVLAASVGILLFAAGEVRAQAQAKDFTFRVGLELYNLHDDIEKVAVRCHVCPVPEARCFTGSASAMGFARTEISTGGQANFNQTVTVSFDAKPAFDPHQARSWRCILLLQSTIQGSFGNPAPGNPHSPLKTKENTEFKGVLSGTFQVQ